MYLQSSEIYERYIPSVDNEIPSFNFDTIPSIIDLCLCSDIVNMSSTDNSVIDYSLMSYRLFPLVSNFTVHDLFPIVDRNTRTAANLSSQVKILFGTKHVYNVHSQKTNKIL